LSVSALRAWRQLLFEVDFRGTIVETENDFPRLFGDRKNFF
jgi:hypothetical protein